MAGQATAVDKKQRSLCHAKQRKKRLLRWLTTPIVKYSVAVIAAILLPYFANHQCWPLGVAIALPIVGLYMCDVERERKKKGRELR
jgi:hypothetical protein